MKYTAKEVEELFNEFEKGWHTNEIQFSNDGVNTFLKSKGIIQSFKVGWYKNIDSGTLAFRTSDTNNYGVRNGLWNENIQVSNINCWQEATHEEVETALINEAKKRGLWEVPIIDVDMSIRDKKGYFEETLPCDLKTLWSSYGRVFENGKWATIIEEELTLAQVCKELGRDIKIVK